MIKTTLFSDVKIETKFCFYNKPFNLILLSQTNVDKFFLKFIQKKLGYLVYLKKKKIVKYNNERIFEIIRYPW